jgi:hypothetical protein
MTDTPDSTTFRKKPVVIKAIQFIGKITQDHPGVYWDDGRAYVVTIHGQRCYIEPGDWIIPEPDGVHFYPCKPDIFEATYERVDAAPASPQLLPGEEMVEESILAGIDLVSLMRKAHFNYRAMLAMTCTRSKDGIDIEYPSFNVEEFAKLLTRAVLQRLPQLLPGEEMVEELSKAYADATGYYVPFHRGLSSESADKIRTGIRAVLQRLSSRETGVADRAPAISTSVEGATQRAENFAEYRIYGTPNWDGYGAAPITKQTVEWAEILLAMFRAPPETAPCVDGTIGFEWIDSARRKLFLYVGERGVNVYFSPARYAANSSGGITSRETAEQQEGVVTPLPSPPSKDVKP